MALVDKRTASVIFTLLLFAAAGAFLYGARHTIVAFLFAIFFAYLLDPAVSFLERTKFSRNSRGLAILYVYIVVALLIAAFATFVGPTLVAEGKKFGAALPGLLENVTTGRIAQKIGASRGWSYTTQLKLEQFLSAHRESIVRWASELGARAATLATNAVWIILIPILAVFFLRDGRNFAEAVIEIVERRRQRQFLRGIVDDLNLMLAGYIRAQLVLAAVSLVVYTAVLSVLHVPYAIILGAVGGVLEFIPVMGPLVAAAAIIGTAFLTNYSHLLMVVVFLALWRLVQDYVVAPRVMGGRVELHPLAALFAVLVGGEIAGVIGVYLSIPIMATLRILWRRWHRYAAVEPEPGTLEITTRQ